MSAMRPLNLGEILDRTIQLFRSNVLLFAGIALLPSALAVTFTGAWSLYVTTQMPAFAPQPGQPPNLQATLILFLAMVGFLVIGVPLLLGAYTIGFAALNHAAVQRARGEAATIRNSYAFALRSFWRYLGIFSLQMLFAGVLPGIAGAMIIGIAAMAGGMLAVAGAGPAAGIAVGLLTFLLFTTIVVVCIWIWLRFCLAFPASIAEGLKAWPSLMRSNQLGKGTRGRIFVMYLLVAVMALVVYYTLTIPVDLVLKFTIYKSTAGIAFLTRPPIGLLVFNLFVSCMERAFVMPISVIALLLFYTDQRVRNEGYDIELLMHQAGWSNLQPPPPPQLPPSLAAAPSFSEQVANETLPEAGESSNPHITPVEQTATLGPEQSAEGAGA